MCAWGRNYIPFSRRKGLHRRERVLHRGSSFRQVTSVSTIGEENIGDDAAEAARMVRKGGARDTMALTTRAQAKEKEKQEFVLRRKEI